MTEESAAGVVGRRRLVPARLGLGLALASALAVLVLTLYLVRDPTPRYLERRSQLASVSEGAPELIEGQELQLVQLAAASGLAFELAVVRPTRGAAADADTSRRRVVVMLGGLRTGRDAAKLIGDTRGAVIAAISYPYHGDTRLKGPAVVLHAPAIRRAILDTPPALMLALDYLLMRPDVDPARVELVGVSLGAPFACVAGALDERFGRVWSVHGGGDPYRLLEFNLRDRIRFGPARAAAAAAASVLISGPSIAPERWVGRIAPRPFVMINAEQDERIPRRAVLDLYSSARAPKQLTWLDGPHVLSRRPEVVRHLVQMVLATMDGLGTPESGLWTRD